jgi:protein involved in polysaccharide export with SLBB domain
MWARSIFLALVGLFAVTVAARAQDALSTQSQVTLGGNDQRGLPGTLPPPFGSTLFSGPVANAPTPPPSLSQPAPNAQAQAHANFDPSYVVQPGDAVDVQLFGATAISAPSTVNANGDIFIPTVGPVHVGGTAASALEGVVNAAVQQVYVQNVKVYAALLSAIPVKIFVTGAVAHPGQYSASSTDSVVAALQYAGGIDPASGSYRDIKILRHGALMERIDLYQFLIQGDLPPFTLRNNDTIVVGPQALTVSALGAQRGNFRYELSGRHTGDELLALAPPRADTTHVSLVGIRDGRPAAFYLTLADFAQRVLLNGDVVRMVADTTGDMITVTIDGRIDGPTTLVLRREATLQEALSYIPVSPKFADIESVYLRRPSVAVAQKKAIEESVLRLQSSIVSAPLIGDSDASIRTQESALVDKFATEARAIEPEGRVVVSRHGKVGDVRLENGDVIVIPPRTDLVDVTGEVSIPQAVVWDADLSVNDYLELAGGVTPRADSRHIIVQRASGETIIGASTPVRAGDRLIVLPAEPDETLPILKDITAVIYQIAVGVGVALRP